MPIYNSEKAYGTVSKIFHWLTALYVIGLLSVGWWMSGLDKASKPFVYNLHKLNGLLLLTLTLIYLIWRFIDRKPAFPFNMPNYERWAARIVHTLLTLSIFIMTLSGWGMSTASQRYPHLLNYHAIMPFIPASQPLAKTLDTIHIGTAWVVLTLVIIHLLAALKHHWINKDMNLTANALITTPATPTRHSRDHFNDRG